MLPLECIHQQSSQQFARWGQALAQALLAQIGWASRFPVLVGGGMGRTPVVGTEINAFVPWQQILVYIDRKSVV